MIRLRRWCCGCGKSWVGERRGRCEACGANEKLRGRRVASCLAEVLEGRVVLAANVIVAPTTYEFRDLGFDPATQVVAIVGYDVVGSTKTATLFEINAVRLAC